MKKALSILLLIVLLSSVVCGQNRQRASKYQLGMELALGYSFPDFKEEQDRWRATFYPAGAMTVLLSKRLHRHWVMDAGLGLTAYFLTHKGSIDKYVLDFASPHFTIGGGYYTRRRNGREHFVKLSTGAQLGYQGTFVDEFETYRVLVNGTNVWYPFIRPEIGLRQYAKKKMRGFRYPLAFEYGAYFRYNWNTLGRVVFEEVDFSVALEPRGSILGAYFRVLFPAGRKSTRFKPERERELPPIIYHPRNKQ